MCSFVHSLYQSRRRIVISCQLNLSLGKTFHVIRHVIAEAYARNEKTTGLVIVMRKSLTGQQKKEFEDAGIKVVTYTVIGGKLKLDQAPISIWQIDSVKRGLSNELPPLDFIYVDEWSVCMYIMYVMYVMYVCLMQVRSSWPW